MMHVFRARQLLYGMSAVLALLASGCGISSQPASRASLPAPLAVRSGAFRLVWEPQAGLSPWLSAIAHAHHKIVANWYLLTDPSLIAALRSAAARGVVVHVLIDGQPYHDASAVFAAQKAFAGSRVVLRQAPRRFTGRYHFDHAKYLVIDPGTLQAVALLGSPNGTASAFDGINAEDAIHTRSLAVTDALYAVFQADWTGHPVGASPRRTLVLSPGAQPALVPLLTASGPVAVTAEELGSAPALYQALDSHHAQARVLVPASLSASEQTRAAALIQAGVHVRMLSRPYVHAKLIVTGHDVFVGSQNFSTVSLSNNREVGIILPQGALRQQALAWFNALWAKAVPWSPHSRSTGTRWPYLPSGDSPTQVRQLWGTPPRITSQLVRGHSATLWHYQGGTVVFVHQRVATVWRVRS